MKLIWTEEELPQGSDEWLAWRKGEGETSAELTLGGSEIASLMYLSPWSTPFDLYQEKMGIVQKEFSDQAMAAMNRGTKLEPVARAYYEKQFGVSARQLCAIHPTKHWMRTSLDGMTEDNKVILEIKSPASFENHIKQTKSGFVPEYRYPQTQWQIAVMREHFEGVERVDYVSFWQDEKFTDMKIIKVEPNEDFIKEIIRRAEIFIQHLRDERPPKPNLFVENLSMRMQYPTPRRKKTAVPAFF